MSARSFAQLLKDATVRSVHAVTAIGNERRKGKTLSVVANKKPNDDGEDGDAFETTVDVVKVDAKHGLVLGFAIICKKDGAEYFDLQGDHIPEDAMLTAAVDFMAQSRMAKEMHEGDAAGSILFAMPLTTDIAKAFGVDTKTTGLMIAMKPNAAVLGKFRDGTYTGFSIGGARIRDEEVADD